MNDNRKKQENVNSEEMQETADAGSCECYAEDDDTEYRELCFDPEEDCCCCC
ncbi:MAG: hypothetical protein ACOZF0_21975 [Thermodesulfobacteriota bacterium]